MFSIISITTFQSITCFKNLLKQVTAKHFQFCTTWAHRRIHSRGTPCHSAGRPREATSLLRAGSSLPGWAPLVTVPELVLFSEQPAATWLGEGAEDAPVNFAASLQTMLGFGWDRCSCALSSKQAQVSPNDHPFTLETSLELYLNS